MSALPPLAGSRTPPSWSPQRVGDRAVKIAVLDLCAGFGVVAPILSLCQLRIAFAQWRDQRFVAHNPATSARIESLERVDHSRVGTSTQAVLSFAIPPDGTQCRIAIDAGAADRIGDVGATIEVVPRGSLCQPPVVPAQLADPGLTVVAAAMLMAIGFAGLKAWSALGRRPGWTKAMLVTPQR